MVQPSPEQRIVEWYRPLIVRRWLHVVLPSAFILLGAAALIGFGLMNQQLGVWSDVIVVLGVLGAIAGPTRAVWGVLKLMKHDTYLALCADGIRYHSGLDDGDAFVAWTALDTAEAPDADTLHLAVEAGEPLVVRERFVGIDNAELAQRILAIQRKALLNVPLG